MHRIRLYVMICLLVCAVLIPATFIAAVCNYNPGPGATTGNDTIDCPTNDANIAGDAGDDSITVDNGVTITGDAGGDSIGGVPGNGNDTITNDGTVTGNIYGDSQAGTGNGADTIVNNGTVDNRIVGDSLNGNSSGNDVIINNGTMNNAGIYGDSRNGVGTGQDTLVNNGTTGWLNGDSNANAGTGSDTITNNGTITTNIDGDSYSGTGSGNDNITNNGVIVGDIYGDSVTNTGSGSDTITNNGDMGGSIYGDTVSGNGSGSDTITNTGTTANIYGDEAAGTGSGDDTITNSGTVNGDIVAGGGNDTVTIQSNAATVDGTINGGAGTDTLTFEFSSTDAAELDALAAEIAAANPNGGTITFRGQVYTWSNFEELRSLLTYLGAQRLNGLADPVAVFCAASGGVDIYAISQQGTSAYGFWVSAPAVNSGLDQATTGNQAVLIGNNPAYNVALYALPGGELQVNQGSFVFQFRYEVSCGALPAAGEQGAAGDDEERLSLLIINRPR